MGQTPNCATLRSPAAKWRNAGKTRAKGCLKLGAPISFTRLAGVPIKSASSASENRRKRRTPKSISDAESAFEVGSADDPYETGRDCQVCYRLAVLGIRERPKRSRVAAAFAALAAASLSSPDSRANSQPVMPMRTRSACFTVFTWP